MIHLEIIPKKLQEFGLTVKMPKCQWAMADCTYLKLEAVKNFPIPNTKKEVWSFLGLTGYYRCFIKDYAAIAVPLNNSTRKECSELVVWIEECDKTFNALKNVLISTVLHQLLAARTLRKHLFFKQMPVTMVLVQC